MGFVLRFFSFLVLVIAILVASVDAIQSVSASKPVLTSLSTALMAGGETTQAFVENLERSFTAPGLTATALHWVLRQPAFAVFLLLSLMLWMIGYRREPVAGRFSA